VSFESTRHRPAVAGGASYLSQTTHQTAAIGLVFVARRNHNGDVRRGSPLRLPLNGCHISTRAAAGGCPYGLSRDAENSTRNYYGGGRTDIWGTRNKYMSPKCFCPDGNATGENEQVGTVTPTGMTVPISRFLLPPRSLSGVFEFRRSARFTKARGAFRAGPHSVIFQIARTYPMPACPKDRQSRC